MLDQTKIDNIAKATATSHWGAANIVGASSSPIIDYDGNPALQITIFLTSELSTAQMPKNAAINTLTEVHDKLLKAGDDRFPFIRYTTQANLTARSDDEL